MWGGFTFVASERNEVFMSKAPWEGKHPAVAKIMKTVYFKSNPDWYYLDDDDIPHLISHHRHHQRRRNLMNSGKRIMSFTKTEIFPIIKRFRTLAFVGS